MAQKPLDYNATITDWNLLTDQLVVFRLKQDTPFDGFTPGQYTVLGINYEAGSVSRAYSIGSAPETIAEGLEFYIRRVPEPKGDVALTHLLFNLKAGERLWCAAKPRGHFTIEKAVGAEDPRHKVFIAAGTGLAPFTSMVKSHYLRHGAVDERHIIAHGASYATDLGYREELERIMNSGGRTRYVPTLSRPDASWTGERGRVETHFEGERLAAFERKLGFQPGHLRPENAVVFLCGLQGTIANCLMQLLDRGFVPEDRKIRRALHIPDATHASFFFEQYDSEPIIDLKDEALAESLRARLRAAGVKLEAPEPVA
ncbi:MAG: FAD-binding oxidoreductase [Candidatus Sumerlaeia bacterium]|nr:FAD-binding oxidoreductase [Candidatus Sumerlaeia bacterium]